MAHTSATYTEGRRPKAPVGGPATATLSGRTGRDPGNRAGHGGRVADADGSMRCGHNGPARCGNSRWNWRMVCCRNSHCCRSSRYCHRNRCRSEEHTSELQSLMRISYAVFCLKKKKPHKKTKLA